MHLEPVQPTIQHKDNVITSAWVRGVMWMTHASWKHVHCTNWNIETCLSPLHLPAVLIFFWLYKGHRFSSLDKMSEFAFSNSEDYPVERPGEGMVRYWNVFGQNKTHERMSIGLNSFSSSVQIHFGIHSTHLACVSPDFTRILRIRNSLLLRKEK